MSMEMKQQLRMAQQMIMTPQLQMAIKLLQVSRMELLEEVREAINENPVLEDAVDAAAEQARDDPDAHMERNLSGETETTTPKAEPRDTERELPSDGQAPSDVDWETYLANAATAPSNDGQGYRTLSDDLPTLEQTYSRGTSLAEHLLGQLKMSDPQPDEERVGVLIIGNLDADGYLKEPPLLDLAQEADVSMEVAERTLKRVQRFDPVGCGSRTLQECLLVQAAVREIDDEVLVAMLTRFLSDLEKRNYTRIARELKVDVEEIYEAAKDIQTLDPRPGREYSTDEAQHITPDVYVKKVGDGYEVQVNDDGMPKLRISNYYLSTMKKDDKAAKEYVQERLRSAKWLIDSIHQRQRTIVKVTESILKFQRDFFDKGIHYLKPLILRDVAEDIRMHESTISRATNNKYVETPQGLFELKYFFNAGINREDGAEDIASEAVKRMIKQLCGAEDPARPLSDQKIVELLKEKHKIDIARRTVAKYREQLGILPSAQRKKSF